MSFSFSPPPPPVRNARLSRAGVSTRWNPYVRYTARIRAMAASRTSTSRGRRSRMPRGGEVSIFTGSSWSGPDRLVGAGQDHLGLARVFQEAHALDDGGEQGRVSALVGDRPEAGHHALEAGVDHLHAKPGGALEHH